MSDSDERVRTHLDNMIASDRTAEALGVTVEQAGEGRATVSMTVRKDMLNGHGSCHGGFLFTLADIAFSYACNSHGVLNVAAAADIQYVAPAAEGAVLQAIAQERMRYGKNGRNGLYDIRVVDTADNSLVAIFTGRAAQIGERAPAS